MVAKSKMTDRNRTTMWIITGTNRKERKERLEKVKGKDEMSVENQEVKTKRQGENKEKMISKQRKV